MASCKKPHQMEFWERDTSYGHLMGLDIGWDPEKQRLNWSKEMKRAEVRKYLIKCECLQCKAMHRKYKWGWIEIDALWCIETRHKYGIKCPYCYHRLNELCSMVVEVEDCGTPSEEEVGRLGLDPKKFVGLEDRCFREC